MRYVYLLVAVTAKLLLRSGEHQMSWGNDDAQFDVVVNHEEQYSIWPVCREIPAGWKAVGVRGSKTTCLDHIEMVWTDMRPLSLRRSFSASPP
jgi:MbtH protein